MWNSNSRAHSNDFPKLCPLCGIGHIKERLGRYGRFWGCTAYPSCTYTESELTHKSDWNDGWDDLDEYDDDIYTDGY